MSHQHNWVEVERFYTPSANRNFKVRGVGDSLLRQLMFGVTTLHLRCACGKVWFKEILGENDAR